MSFLKNLISFGAHGRIERKVEEFEDLKEQYNALYLQMETRREQVNHVLENVIQVKLSAVKSLEKINSIAKNIKSKDREFIYRQLGNQYESVDFKHIDATITAGQTAASATKGLSAGVSTALGAWALASTLGSASTGAAIASLSGAAATNATLAWFGGGALAAGGGGIAAGTAVLGGLVAIPALAVMGVFSHLSANKKINQIEREMNKALEHIDLIEANLLQLQLIEKRSDELTNAIRKAQQVFEHELKQTLLSLNKWKIFSTMIRWVRKTILRRDFYSEKDLQHIAYIGGIASDFAVLIDTPVFDESSERGFM
ncbi:hypothetical protein A7K91_15760 [Paenibacillus oryzae]|uniref:Chemotaxis protein n=1 Tax=Paenibacillus oryzae TaxID=1844972 RepID=A0A1A5YB78_9BACL|nr:hypothetical protein [Paenibacillus oryzae]OBR62843.1 hypothetical protein A7K91_15760 [Paenibacillus oryzae]